MDIVAVVVAGAEHFGVGLVHCGLLGKFLMEHLQRCLFGAVEQPAEQAEHEDVAAFQNGFYVHAAVGQRGLGHRRYGHFHHLSRDSQLLDGVVGLEQRLLEPFGLEGVDVNDDYSALFEKLVALLQGGGIHGYQHVAFVAGGVHAVAYAHLKSAHAAERPLRGAYLCGIVGEGRDGVAETGRNVSENVAGQLHAVAGVAGEPDGHLVEVLNSPGGLIRSVHIVF